MSPDLASWENFFIATSGAAAALAGLVVVAISVNIAPILKSPQLPARAGATIGTLMAILVSSVGGLVPQSIAAFGAEVTLYGAIAWLLQLWSARQATARRLQDRRPWHEVLIGIALGQLQTLPFLASGVLLWGGNESGLFWFAAGVIAAFTFAMTNAWILLIEILR